MSDDDILICSHKIPGFSLVTKRWDFFDVPAISEIKFNQEAFDRLVLPRHQKDLIFSLAKEQQSKEPHFDDLIKGKGKGLIFFLYGDPGVGKTLTAESIAEYIRRPLYTIGCGDLGADSKYVEEELTRTLILATKWDALVLVDKADVFMEQRSNNGLQRNGLVSVLLRILEYFEGIMFLTTNRVGSIDTVFKSRIHLSISYPPLSIDARRTIWEGFITKGVTHGKPDWLDHKFLNQVASHTINGCQIKNIVRMGRALAASTKCSLEPDDILIGLKALNSFENDFVEAQFKRVGNESWCWKFSEALRTEYY
ncbi:P-loop containing nucleoside triphosphate hydrolase protein [Zopfia rhizophila CBS 207.26]|uniref:P-loop containing nucleoside triphosphate hydrolase protein n=1 Tax=Zopfia rhizophila CBS 207.26 TaxID=1314779 RepID=A0A6A6DYF6_9PEZI|nr:P-loop containing nucleoside triphosphate hydrolase protein [Zopfia rhizophila CBS 207.26]